MQIDEKWWKYLESETNHDIQSPIALNAPNWDPDKMY